MIVFFCLPTYVVLSYVRYQSFRRTLRGRSGRRARPPLPTPEAQSSSSDTTSSSAVASSNDNSNTSDVSNTSSATSSGPSKTEERGATSTRSSSMVNSPPVKFLLRPDFIDFLKNSGVSSDRREIWMRSLFQLCVFLSPIFLSLPWPLFVCLF